MAYTFGAAYKVGPQTSYQHVEIPVTLDTSTTGTVAHTFGIVPQDIALRNVGAPASLAAIGTVTATNITINSNGTAGSYVIVLKSTSQAG